MARITEDFRGQVHQDQYSIPFWPEPGDIIIRKIIDHDTLDDDHMSKFLMSTFGPVELYKDNYYCSPERCPDPARRAAYHRIYFRNGDHIIRRSKFKQENNYALTEEDYSRVWVYWPGYQLHNTFVRLISWGYNDYGILTLQPPVGRFRFRAQTLTFHDDMVMWEPGDMIVRYFEPGPAGAPNPGWYRLIGVQEVDEFSQRRFLEDGDILIKQKGRQELPPFPTEPVRMNTRMELFAYMYNKLEDAWIYVCGDTMLYDFNNWDSVMNLPRIDAVPQSVDIMISLNEEFTPYDEEVSELGGYVKFYQNPATSIDPRVPPTIVYNPTRVPEDGATTSSALAPNLPAYLRAGWLEPHWDHLSVPVPDAAHPMVLRFGRWAEETSPHAEAAYRWIWHPYIELFQRHPRSNDGQTYFTADRAGINYGEGRGHPAWEEFTETGLEMNGLWPAHHFPVLQGDVIIRRDLRHPVHPVMTHQLMPATNAAGRVRCCPGDLLVRFGLIDDPDADRHDIAARNQYHFGVELWLLMLDGNVIPHWAFRGRDQVVFGFVPNPKAQRHKRAAGEVPLRIPGTYNGQTYYYNAPGSKRCRTALVAVEGGIPVGASQAAKRKRSRRLSSEEEENKENPPPKKLIKFTLIKATRQKIESEILIPKFLNHETGNYSRIQEDD